MPKTLKMSNQSFSEHNHYCIAIEIPSDINNKSLCLEELNHRLLSAVGKFAVTFFNLLIFVINQRQSNKDYL